MLFNSFTFIFIFLPITLLGFHLIGNRGHNRLAISWLVGASLFFYGWWNPKYLGLLGYFKYSNFFVDNINALTGGGIVLERIILPLGTGAGTLSPQFGPSG